MILGNSKKNDKGRMEVDILAVDDLDIAWLSEAANNYTNADDNAARKESREKFREIVKEALNKVRP